jgi:hydrocephalus-inducing protein
MVNFGSILNDTSKKIHVNMKNVSEMPIYYEWTFVEEELVQHSLNEAERNSSDSRNSIREPKTVPINEVFDILPLSGYLNVGESE